MFVFSTSENEATEALTTCSAAPSGQKATLKSLPMGAVKTMANYQSKERVSGKSSNGHIVRVAKKKSAYTEEPVAKDSLWNIYTGNPGFYVTKGDTINFGNVVTMSDSAFLEAQRLVVPKTIKPYGFVGKELVLPNQDWILGLILILWMIFASVRVVFLKYLSQLFISLFQYSAASRLYKQRGYKTKFGAIRLDFIFYLVLPLSVYQIATFYEIDVPGFPAVFFFLALLLVINGYFFTKILLYRMAGTIVMLKDQTDETVFNIRLYYKALGICLLPVATVHAVIVQTNSVTVWIMAILIFVMYLSTALRSIYVGSKKGISIFYLILYLCTLEILPLLLIFKLMSTE